jgi:dipeptidyl aminopeptidase/acylaminoacyl peptidase
MKRATLLLVLLAMLGGLVSASNTNSAQGGKKMTIEEALAIKDVGAPQWSPDGKHLAFTVSEWNKKEDRRDSHIYIVSPDGGGPIRLTNGDRGENAPQWAPDGRRLAFLANRDSGSPSPEARSRGNQVWVISLEGGEAEKVTDEEGGVSSFRWSPDGKSMALIVRDTPKDKTEREKQKKDKFDAIVVDHNLMYSHLWVFDLDKQDKKDKRRLTEGSMTVSDPQWSPDGRWIACSMSKSSTQESAYTDISDDRNSDVFVLPAAGGERRQLTTNPGPDFQARWSPDGKWIAYLSTGNAWAGKTDLMLAPAQGGAAKNLTSAYADSIFGQIEWSHDGSAIYAPGAVGVYEQFYRIPVSSGAMQPVFEKPAGYGVVVVSPDGHRLAFTMQQPTRPGDIWVSNASGKDAKPVTHINPEVKDIALSDTEVIKWKGADGLEIEGMLTKPLGYESGKRYPTILEIHGGPYGKYSYGFNSRVQIMAANGYAVLQGNPRGSTGYGNKFTIANVKDWGGKDYQDLMAGVDEVIKLGVADKDRLGVMGGSYGGFMTFWVVSQTSRFKAAIAHAAISDWYSFFGQSDIPGLMEYGFGGLPWIAKETYIKYSPITYVDHVKTPLMITHGEQDHRVPIAQAEEYYRSLQRRGLDMEFIRYPREGHGIGEPNHQIDLVHRQVEWMDKHLKAEKADAAGMR